MKQQISVTLQLLVFLVLGSFLIGCQSKSKLVNTIYFNQHKDSLLATVVAGFQPTIQPGDRLMISITALDPVSVAPYNQNIMNAGNNTASPGYLVENDGTIKMPQFGKIFVNGYKISRLVDTITNRVSKFVSDPMVNIQFVNFKVTIIGEVNRPAVLNVSEGKLNIVEAIGLTGDLTNYARRENIMVIRETNGKREFGEVNLLSLNSFNSPYYNLQQNDIVYVEPTKAKATSTDQTLLRNLSIATSVLSVISTVFFLVINLTK